MTHLKLSVLAPMCLAAACSSNGSTGSETGQYRTFVNDTQTLLNRNGYQDFRTFGNYTPASDIPATATFEMDGYAALFFDGTPTLAQAQSSTLPDPSHIGELNLIVNLGVAEDILTGRASNFYDATDSGAYSGALDFTDSRQRAGSDNTPNDAFLIVKVSGTITSPDGVDYRVDSSAGGVFVGASGVDGIAGIIEGEVTSGGVIENFVGAYVAD